MDLQKQNEITAIASEINNNILSIKLPDSLALVRVDRYVFPDHYPIRSHDNERIFILKNKNKK